MDCGGVKLRVRESNEEPRESWLPGRGSELETGHMRENHRQRKNRLS